MRRNVKYRLLIGLSVAFPFSCLRCCSSRKIMWLTRDLFDIGSRSRSFERNLTGIFPVHSLFLFSFSSFLHLSDLQPIPPACERDPPAPAVFSLPPLPLAPRPSPRRSRHSFTSNPGQWEIQPSPGPSPQPSPRSKHKTTASPPSSQVTAATPPVQNAHAEASPSPKSSTVTPSSVLHLSKFSQSALTSPEPSAVISSPNSPSKLTSPASPSSITSSSSMAPNSSSHTVSTTLATKSVVTAAPQPPPPLTWTPSLPPSLPRIFQAGSEKGISWLAGLQACCMLSPNWVHMCDGFDLAWFSSWFSTQSCSAGQIQCALHCRHSERCF